jgi:hypothetical protein
MEKASAMDAIVSASRNFALMAGVDPKRLGEKPASMMQAERVKQASQLQDLLGQISIEGQMRKLESTDKEKILQLAGRAYIYDPKTKKLRLIEGQELQKEMDGVEKAKERYYNTRADYVEEMKRLAPKKFASMEAERNELKTSTLKAFTEKSDLLKKLGKVEAAFDPKKVGPVTARMQETFATYGGKDGDKQAYRAKAGRILADYIKSISGAAVTDKERKFLSSQIPNVKMTPEVFKALLADMKNETYDSANTILDVHEKNEKIEVPELREMIDTYYKGPAKDTKIQEYANQYNLSYDQASSILKGRGYGKK